MPAGVLFVHSNFPAQFRGLAEALKARGVPCWAIGAAEAPGVQGVRILRYRLPRGTTPGIFNLAIRAEADLIRGRMALEAARRLKSEGADPAVIVGHPGWGETALLDQVFPHARQVLFHEFFYRGVDVSFDFEFRQPNEEGLIVGKAKNAVMALAFADADVIVSPTRFQAGLLPKAFQARTRIIHEGIDTDAVRPGPAVPFPLDDGRVITPGSPVITHLNNMLEPLRGLHIFARALPRLLDEVPDAQVLIFGSDEGFGYGGDPPEGKSWKALCLRGVEDRLDPARVHFLGKAEHARMVQALRLSTVHVYYSYPFVLSWSLAEAMAAGCYVVASDTAPLHDAITDGVDGRLLPFFDVEALSQAMIDACRDPAASAALRQAARRTALARFDRRAGVAGWMGVLAEMGLEIPPAPESPET